MQAFLASAKNSKHLGNVERFRGITPKELAYPTWANGHQASHKAAYWCCRASHLGVWSQCILDKTKHVLIFEDDAVIPPDFDQRVDAFFAELPDDWFGYMLGGHVWKGAEKVSENCGRLRGGGALHCYGLNGRGLQRNYDHLLWWRDRICDHATNELYAEEPHYYAPKEYFVAQSGGFSDNSLDQRPSGGLGVLW